MSAGNVSTIWPRGQCREATSARSTRNASTPAQQSSCASRHDIELLPRSTLTRAKPSRPVCTDRAAAQPAHDCPPVSCPAAAQPIGTAAARPGGPAGEADLGRRAAARLSPASLSAVSQGGIVRWIRSSTSASSLARVSLICRCLGPCWSAVMNGRLISVWIVEESSILTFSAASLKRCSASRSPRRSIPCCFRTRPPESR